MPMHGEYRMLRLHAGLAATVGVPIENTFVLDNGDSLTLSKHKVTRGYPVEHGNTYIDGKDIKGLAETVMEDRRVLTDDGMIAITVSIDSKKNTLVNPPSFATMGVIKSDDTHFSELGKLLEQAINEKLLTRTMFSDLKIIIKNTASEYIYKKTRRRPMIIPVIMSNN